MLNTLDGPMDQPLRICFISPKHLPTQLLYKYTYARMTTIEQYFHYFYTEDFTYSIANNMDQADIVVWDENTPNNSNMNPSKINLLISVENMPHWKKYHHYVAYGSYGNPLVNIYLYNHISKINQQDKYIAIPLIHYRMNYYSSLSNKIMPTEETPIQKKHFCLIINKSRLNSEIWKYANLLSPIGRVDNIEMYSNITYKSCYNSVELLNVFNKYKFILCFENSYADGYITEKIFNCFFAKTIPIYKGDPNVKNYFTPTSFVDAWQDPRKLVEEIKKIYLDDELYTNMVNSEKISKTYDDENYKSVVKTYIRKHMSKKSDASACDCVVM